jgi:hypothetical protein
MNMPSPAAATHNEDDMARIAVVAIARNEKPFLDEWLLYHRLVGIDHFFIYDDDPVPNLQEFLRPHEAYATIIHWHDKHQAFPGQRGDRQTKAYVHALECHLAGYDWVAFIDLDEFLVFRKHANIKSFLASLGTIPAVALNCHIFGHNGHYTDPEGLVTSTHTRRRLHLGRTSKCINRCDAIAGIESVHRCKLKHGRLVDANGRPFTKDPYPEKADIAHVNHYQCKSFARWMDRPARGDACDVPALPENSWKSTKDGCLRRFVETVALNHNEHVDEYMLQYKDFLERAIRTIRPAPPNSITTT